MRVRGHSFLRQKFNQSKVTVGKIKTCQLGVKCIS